jgi:hypothetical protein
LIGFQPDWLIFYRAAVGSHGFAPAALASFLTPGPAAPIRLGIGTIIARDVAKVVLVNVNPSKGE